MAWVACQFNFHRKFRSLLHFPFPHHCMQLFALYEQFSCWMLLFDCSRVVSFLVGEILICHSSVLWVYTLNLKYVRAFWVLGCKLKGTKGIFDTKSGYKAPLSLAHYIIVCSKFSFYKCFHIDFSRPRKLGCIFFLVHDNPSPQFYCNCTQAEVPTVYLILFLFQVAMKLAPDRSKFMEVLGGDAVKSDIEQFLTTFTPLLQQNHKFLVS